MPPGVGGALLAAWLQPAAGGAPRLAVPVRRPWLAIVGWVRPRIAATGRLGLAIVLSVALSAHLVYWLALATGGYRRETIFAVAALLALPIPIGVLRGGARSVLDQASAAWHALRRDWFAFALAAGCAAFVAAVLQAGLWHATPNGIAAGGSNWSDLGVHLSIAQSLNAGNFPPQVPYFAGEPLVYHWFADFHAAIAARSAGIFAIPGFVVSSAILAGALALLVHGLARALLRGQGARRAAAAGGGPRRSLAGGFGWMRLVGDVANGFGDLPSAGGTQLIRQLVADRVALLPDPIGDGDGLLVHRATTAGLPMLVGAVLLLVAGLPAARARAAGWRDRPALISLAGLLGALLAPFHFFFFPAFLALALAGSSLSGRLFDRDAPRNAALLLAPYLLAVPFAIAAVAAGRRQRVAEMGRSAGNRRRWPTARGRSSSSTPPPGRAVRARPAGAAPAARPASRLPGDLAGDPFRGAERGAGERHRLRHEQVLPGDVDRRRRAGRLADPALAGCGRHGGPAGERPLAAPRLGLDGAQPPGGAGLERGRGRGLDRRQHAGALRLRDQRLAQLADRSRRPAAGADLHPVHREPRLFARPGVCGGRRDLLLG